MGPSDRETREFLRRIAVLAIVLAALLAAGTVGYRATLGWNAWDSFVLALGTIATLGAHSPERDAGAEGVEVMLLILGAGTLGYALVTVTEFFVAGHLGGVLVRRRNQRRIDSLSDHFIICGYGRVGRQVARDLRAAGAAYVIVDDNPDHRELEAGAPFGVRFLFGRPSDDDTLTQAGIERARAVIACVDSDAENIFITL